MIDLKTKKIVVTGGGGFLGSALMERLRQQGCAPSQVVAARKADFDLVHEADVKRLFEVHQPQVVIHLAAVVGGIGANRENPGSFYYQNLVMGAMLMEYARQAGVEKFVAIGTICAYPKFTPVPFREEDLWVGYPEETNAPYGIAKKGLLVQSQAYRAQYGFNSIYLLPVNLYGPRDNFDPRSSHVIPALIRKCVEAVERGDEVLEVWGTGRATREFLYVDDAAEAIVLATEHYDGAEPVNLGAGLRDQHQGPRGADRAPLRVPRPPGLEHVAARRPAPPLPGHHPRRRLLRLPGVHALRRGAAADDRVVPQRDLDARRRTSRPSSRPSAPRREVPPVQAGLLFALALGARSRPRRPRARSSRPSGAG